MALTAGTRLGVYEITAQIGEGGMGQVYRATDTRLKRQVAIKILPPSLAADADRLARFQREAEVLASLNHPNIAAIHGLEEGGGMTALVMELVEGEDLSQRIARGAIPIDEALPIAKQIADALEAAHEQGIIHRDLKPANIKIRTDGTVKVLDFGLAKALAPGVAGATADAANSPTLSVHATQAGVILGTAAYMAPEQARGKIVDRRADIWAFGAVLFEMLAGTRAFPGEDLTDTLAAVVKLDPAWDTVGDDVPARVRQVVRLCLQKDPRQRVQAMGDVRLALEGAFETTALPTPATMPSSGARGRSALIAALAAVAVLAAALTIPAVRHLRETPPTAPAETRLELVTPDTDQPTSFALSPDGRQIVFVASGDGPSRLWLRSLATTTSQPLAGTEGARFPFWSPDSRSIGFFDGDGLKRLDLGGRTPQTLAAAVVGRGGAWTAEGIILFAPAASGPLMRVSATGGEVVPVTTLGPQQSSHRWPVGLPDGRFLFYAVGTQATSGIFLGTLDGSAPARLAPADSAGAYLAVGPGRAEGSGEGGLWSAAASREDGWLLWVRGGTLLADRLDVSRGALIGKPVALAEGVAVAGNWSGAFSVATTGLVAYRGEGSSTRQLTWVDRSGKVLGTLAEPNENELSHPSLSPDGRRVAVTRTVKGNTDVWLLDGARMSRATFDPGIDQLPFWSSDGTRIVFESGRTGQRDLYQKLASGAGVEERLVASDQSKTSASLSADGHFLLYSSLDPLTAYDLWVVPIAPPRTSGRTGARGGRRSHAVRVPEDLL